MKLIFGITCLTLILIGSCKPSPSKDKPQFYKGDIISENSDLNGVKWLAAYVAESVLDSCQTNTFLRFPELIAYTPKMYQLLRYSNYQYTCDIVKEKLGTIHKYELKESFFTNDGLLLIYRYQIITDKLEEEVELRIVFTSQKKLTEFQFYYWNDEYTSDLIKMNWF